MHFPAVSKDFFSREDVVQISKDLLGMHIYTCFNDQVTIGKIVETEAYRGADDKACHAYNGRRTKRTQTMYLQGGHAYVYLCYGIHHLFNFVVGPKEVANAVLIRGIEPIEGVHHMLERRNMTYVKYNLTAGPGTLSRALGIGLQHNGLDLTLPNSPIRLLDKKDRITENNIIASPRVGIGYAKECAAWPWRFRLKGSKWTSPAK
ncbi:MAG: DNA-3-methyladenine glycosylase [Saprospiraceae bacterium]|nr:DNA-3-methyladenine glycosylase [Saprospiraceae bacterium]